ncbi:hypothetical protein PESHB4_15920 [Pediococcus ethanolidurans]
MGSGDSGIVEPINVAVHELAQAGKVINPITIQTFTLHQVKETFDGGIVMAIALSGHTLNNIHIL